MSNLTGAIQVASGSQHVCALLASGGVKCWGDNAGGQLGATLPDDETQSNVPVEVSGLSNVIQITAGAGHNCALLLSGGVKCWGYGSFGRLGHGANDNSVTPVDVSNLSGVIQISAGFLHTCAVLSTGAVKCWGEGDSGRLGNNHARDEDSNVPVDVAGVTGAISTAGGEFSTCVLVVYWGCEMLGGVEVLES